MQPYRARSGGGGFMTRFLGILLLLAPFPIQVAAETLHYSINWQSGLSLGEASLLSEKIAAGSNNEGISGWHFHINLDAAVPGFTIRDEYSSFADDNLCTAEVVKSVTRGTRKSAEKDTVDRENKTVTRESPNGGGRSQYPVPACVHDAMAFLQFVRNELAQGRMVPQQPVILGAKYDITMTYMGTETLRTGGETVLADHVRTVVKGPKSDITFEIYFSQDPKRTPVFARIPLPLGTFTVELLP